MPTRSPDLVALSFRPGAILKYTPTARLLFRIPRLSRLVQRPPLKIPLPDRRLVTNGDRDEPCKNASPPSRLFLGLYVSQPTPSLSPSNPCGSLPTTLKLVAFTWEQSRSGGGDGIHTVGYEGSQLPPPPPLGSGFGMTRTRTRFDFPAR